VERPELKLIAAPEPRAHAGRGAPLALGAALFAAAILGTLLGADRARVSVEAGDKADEALELALQRGIDDTEVHDALVEMRSTLGRRPLDARTRVVYASLLLGLSSSAEDLQLAAFHAGRAAELAPVTVSVVRPAALVLAHAGKTAEALALVRDMFGYEPDRAAALLADLRSRILGVAPDEGIPETSEAWMAWVRQLRQEGREGEEEAWLRRTHERWPDHLPALEQLAARACYAADWTTFDALFAADPALPDEPASAQALAWRARYRARAGDAAGARRDADRALQLGGASAGVRTVAGDVFAALGDDERARQEWSRALHQMEPGPSADRRTLLSRLARLEERHGRPAAALRHWRALLAIEPDHAEARSRVDDLAGFRR
jgi:tetratricopeptide (TPR) repeat protein